MSFPFALFATQDEELPMTDTVQLAEPEAKELDPFYEPYELVLAANAQIVGAAPCIAATTDGHGV